MGSSEIAFLFGFAVFLALLCSVWQLTYSRDRLTEWAAENGFELLSSERRWLMRGGYSLTTTKGQQVFLVTVRDAGGAVREAYVRVGGWFLGQFSRNIDVQWR